MANQLKMALISSILSLRERGWSFRRIARELGVHRETVARHVRLARSKPAKAPLGNLDPANGVAGAESDHESAKAPLGDCALLDVATSVGGARGSSDAPLVGAQPSSESLHPGERGESDPPTRSACAPWREEFLAKLALGLSARRIYQDLVSEHGFAGSYYSVKRFVRRLRTLRKLVDKNAAGQDQFEFASEHELIRPLADYGAFVRGAILRHDDRTGFSRHGRANESAPRAQNPGDAHRRGLRVIHPPWPEYSSPGCTPAEPDSASSDTSNVVPVSSPMIPIH